MDRPKVKLNAQIYDEASAWFVECRAGELDEAGRQEFDHWLRKSPENVSAYLEVAAIWSEGSGLDPARQWDADRLIEEAQRDPENVVPLPISAEPDRVWTGSPSLATVTATHRASSRQRSMFALVASVAVVALIASIWAWFAMSYGIYSTTLGEQRSIELPDGSTVSMNSKSRIRVRYSNQERAVELLAGQALFRVAKDKKRPFLVSADGTRVRAVGTQFDVYRRYGGTVVTVVEGQVAVMGPATRQSEPPPTVSSVGHEERIAPLVSPILVGAGEQLTVTPKQLQKSDHVDVAAATAWTQRQIIFESASLSEVAEEFNRYNERQLVVDDPELLTFHVSGVFSSTDPESLIRFLRDRPGVTVTEEGSVIRIAKKI